MSGHITRKRAIIFALVLYLLLGFVANWSILLGTNTMKWDIWQAEYPMQVITSDAIKSGSIPIWTPFMNYGTPYYAMVGTPVWYPITLLIDFFGYGPHSPAIEYTVHMVIGAFGLFLLGVEHISNDKKKLTISEFVVAFCMGTLYQFSGIFLSNAEHIMIIISAAWFPFALLYSERYAKSKRLLDAMTTGLISGMILLGGYPEMFYDLFLVLIPWMFYWTKKSDTGSNRTVKLGINSLLRLALIAVCAFFASAITIIPFLKLMPQITRGGGQSPMTYPFSAIFTMILPVTADQLSGSNSSMGLYYIGFATIFTLPLIVKSKRNENLFYLFMAAISLFLSFGPNSFLHTFMYRFFPMYSTFRFPTLWRGFVAIFALLTVGGIWKQILNGEAYNRTFGKLLKGCLGIAGGLAMVAYLVSNANTEKTIVQNASDLCNAFILLLAVSAAYFVVNHLIMAKEYRQSLTSLCFAGVVIFEALAVAFKAFPVSVAPYDPIAYFQSKEVQTAIHAEKERYNKRTVTCDLSRNQRTSSKLDSESIAFNKTFDEDGYLSVVLTKTSEYKAAYNRSIIQQNPEVYFTNDVVDSSVVGLTEWRNRPDVSPYQVHVDKNESKLNTSDLISEKTELVSERRLQTSKLDGELAASGPFVTQSNTATKIRLYFTGIGENINSVSLTTTFVKAVDSSKSVYRGTYAIKKDNGSNYVDISLPETGTRYSNFSVKASVIPTSISQVELSRNVKDKNADVVAFGMNSIRVNVNAPTSGILTILQTNYNGWDLYVDGKRTEIKEVNGCFIGVPLDAGKHNVMLKFRPLDFIAGVSVSGTFLVIYVVLLFVDFKKKKTASAKRMEKHNA